EDKGYARLLGKLSMKWNEKQLNDAFNSLKDMLNKGPNWNLKLSGKQFGNAFNYLISRSSCKEIAQKLDEKQLNSALNYCMDKLNDKNEDLYIRINYIKLIISNKCNEQQLNEAFNSSMDIFNDKNNDEDVRGGCAELFGTIA
ncbi:hypothetical protein RFI_39511, partial [Reticulomyxa filosa]